MGKANKPREGSLQFYPRVRAKKFLPRVNWDNLSRENTNLLGFIGYKVGMMSAFVKDNTPNSTTKGKRMIIPVTILECPTIKVLSVRFYKHGKVMGEVLNHNLDAELKRKIKLPKKHAKKIEDFKDFDDVKLMVYSQVKKTGIKKSPDISEIGLSGTVDEKFAFAKENMAKEISVKDVLNDKGKLLDIRGVTIGKGTQGATKRFGLALKSHKSEKGVRNPGSGGPWHPSRVEFMQPMMGQMGLFTRATYNNTLVSVDSIKDKDINPNSGFYNYGKIRTDYVVLRGSVQGPSKRQVLLTFPLRPSQRQIKKNYELLELR